MSNPSKYSGLAGTVLLGTLLGLNYTQYAKRKSPLADKGPAFILEEHKRVGTLFDQQGKVIPLGQTDLPGSDYVRRVRDRIPDSSPLVLCLALSSLWALRSFGAMNRVLNRRYSDIVYQIRRPDVISNRLHAWRVLGMGGSLVPLIFLSGYWYMERPDAYFREDLQGALRGVSEDVRSMIILNPIQPDKSALASAVTDFGKTIRSGLKPF